MITKICKACIIWRLVNATEKQKAGKRVREKVGSGKKRKRKCVYMYGS